MINFSEKSGKGKWWKVMKGTDQWFSAFYDRNCYAVFIANSDKYFIELNHVTLIKSLKYVKNWLSKE